MLGRWFIAKPGADGTRTFGPFSSGQLTALAEAQKLLPGDLIRPENSPDWLPACSLAFLADSLGRPAQVCSAAAPLLQTYSRPVPALAPDRSPWRTPVLVLCTGVLMIALAGGTLVVLWPHARPQAHVPAASPSTSAVARIEPLAPAIIHPPATSPVTLSRPHTQGSQPKPTAKTLEELFDRNDGPGDFSRAEWAVFKRRLYAEGVLGHTVLDGAYEFRYPPDKYLGVLRTMRDVFRDHGFVQATPHQIFNGAKVFLGGSLSADGGVRIRTTSILAKRAGMPLLSRRDFEQLDRAD